MSYNRYSKFIDNGTMKLVPFIKIEEKNTDFYEVYHSGISRLDNISYKYYSDPNYGWLILQANPDLEPFEFLIPNGTTLRIPYPLETTLIKYNEDVDKYEKYYGLN